MSILELLFEATLKGSILITCVGLTLSLFRKVSASTRHLVWLLALVGTLAIPLLSYVIPDWKIAPEHTLRWVSPDAVQGNQLLPTPVLRSGNDTPLPSKSMVPSTPVTTDSHRPTLRTILELLWIGGIVTIALRFALGLLITHQTVKRARVTPAPIALAKMEPLLRKNQTRPRVSVLLNSTIDTPFLWGWRKPVIVLPHSARDWSVRRLDMVLTHEMAHARRYDNITNIIGWLATAVYWFNPMVWIAVKKMRTEQEWACDDLVLSQGVSAAEYAEQLLDLSRSFSPRTRLGLEAAFMNKSQLGERLMAILKRNRRRVPLSISRTALVTLLMAAAILPLAALADRQTVQLNDVTSTQREAIVATLSGFYNALNDGDDYETTCNTYLATGYFDPPGMTMENLEEGVWDAAFRNTLDMFTKKGVAGSLVAQDRIKSIRHVGDRYIATLELNLTGDAYQIESVEEQPGRISIKPVRDPATGEARMTETYLAKALEHEIIFTNSEEGWKILRYEGPIGIKRMDVDNPYGPIFLVWLEDIGTEMTPYGQMISKVIPEMHRPFNNMGIEFTLEN